MSKMQLDQTDAERMHYAQQGDLAAEVDSLARPLVQKGETPGIVVGVLLPDGQMQFFGYGVRDRAGHSQPDGDTLFAVGSLSKGFVGALTTLLVRDGTLSWDDTLGTLLPDRPLSADAKKITLLQLATHTSGLPNQPITPKTFRYFVQYLFTGKNFYRHFDVSYVFHYLSTYKAPKGNKVEYSSLGYALLSDVLEERTHVPIETLLQQNLCRPLGLGRTSYQPETLPGYAERARGYAGDEPRFVRRGKPVPDWHFPEFMKGAAAAYSNARDLLVYASAHVRGDSDPLHAALADTLKVRRAQPEKAPAIAWFVDTVDGRSITYQIGIVAGYTSYLGIDVERKTAVVVLENSFNWTNSVGHRLLIRLSQSRASTDPVSYNTRGR